MLLTDYWDYLLTYFNFLLTELFIVFMAITSNITFYIYVLWKDYCSKLQVRLLVLVHIFICAK